MAEPRGSIKKIGIALTIYRPDPLVFAEQLESIEAQDFPDWCCVATSDSELAELRAHPRLARFFSDPQFEFLENTTRLGHKANFDRAIQLLARQPDVDAIACSDQDDIWRPSKLSVLARELEQSPRLSLVHSDMILFSGSPPGEAADSSRQTLWGAERRNTRNSGLDHMLLRTIVNGAAMMFDAELARRFGPIPESVGYHDQWYSALAAGLGGVYAVPQPLVCYRQHGNNVVGASTFNGRWALPSGGRVRGISHLIRHFRSRWHETATVAQALSERGVDARAPGILKLLTFVVRYWWSDPVLARAAAGRLIGMIL